MSGDILSGICIEIFETSSIYTRVHPLTVDYRRWLEVQDFKTQPYGTSTVSKLLGKNSRNSSDINVEKVKPLIYFLHFHADIDLNDPEKLTQEDVFEHSRVKETIEEYERRRSRAPQGEVGSKFHSAWLGKSFVYALKSPRITEDDDENEDLLDGKHPSGAVGFFSIDTNGVLKGRAYLKYEDLPELVQNGNWELDGKIFADPDDCLFFFYRLNRAPHQKSDRSGYMRLEPDEFMSPMHTGQPVLSGFFVDNDTLAEKNKGKVHAEGIAIDATEHLGALEAMTAHLMGKV